MAAPQWTLGLGGSDHDFSVALMRGEDLLVAIEQERLTRTKNGLSVWYKEPFAEAIDYCLDAAGIQLDDVAHIVASDTIPARSRAALADRGLTLFSHHLCHAASAYLMMPAGITAAILVYDGYGSIVSGRTVRPKRPARETFSFYLFSAEGVRCLGQTVGESYAEEDDFPIGISNSIGMLYEVVTSVLGYGSMESGKTMGLAAHGKPSFAEDIRQFITLGDDPNDCFRCPTDRCEIASCLEALLHEGRGSFATKADIAASAQHIVEQVLHHCAALLPTETVDCIGISGGCGLNSVANAALASRLAPMPTVIPPHCGDAGLGLGALWLHARQRSGRQPRLTFRGQECAPGLARPGRSYSVDECARAVRDFYPRLWLDVAGMSPAALATEISQGAVIGLFSGGSEMGPRALGGRSILADPRSATTRERINRRLKDREPFRPLAPVILDSAYEDWFFGPECSDRYMLKVARARERCLREAPAVVHVDGTARVQSVGPDGDPFLLALLSAFRDVTGVPMLLNTSFNRRGEPIVETPADAIDAFLGLGLDGLYLDGNLHRAA